MAERRMFAKTIVLSDAFLDLPMSARCLYFTLGMLADDDGFVNAPRSIMRQCGASNDDMKNLLDKKFVLLFESGVIVIKHWRINNYLQKDRIQPTKYVEEKAMLTLDEKGGYHKEDPDQDDVYTSVYTQGVYTQNSIVKYSLDKCSVGESSIGLGEEINNTPILEQSIGKGECERENQGRPEMTDQERLEKIKKHSKSIDVHLRFGYPIDGIYRLAAADGITREEIDEYRQTGGTV